MYSVPLLKEQASVKVDSTVDPCQTYSAFNKEGDPSAFRGPLYADPSGFMYGAGT